MTRASKTLVLVNPVAGGGRGRRAQAAVTAYLAGQGFAAEFAASRSSQDLRRAAAEAVAAGYQTLLVLGGDGAFLHLVNGVLSVSGAGDVTLGILPAGNGNDVAAGLGIPLDPVAAARLLLVGEPRRVDAVRARFAEGRSEIYVGAGGMGLDAESARLAHGRFRSWPGVARYIAGALWAMATFRPLDLEVCADDECRVAQVLIAAVCNAPAYGAGVKIAPAARMDDGWLDLTLIAPLSLLRLVEAIPTMLRTGELRWPELERSRARRITLRADRPAVFHGDGELLGNAPVELEILPGALRVLLPKLGSALPLR